MTEQFIQHRVYLTGVSPRTVDWYKCGFRAFEGALGSKQAIIGRIGQLKDKGTSHITINSYLRCINAYFMWLHKEHGKELLRIPKLREEQKILQTLSADGVKAILGFRPVGVNQHRAWLIALAILDTGMRASEVLGLAVSDVDCDNLTLKVKGKGSKYRLVPFSFELRKVLLRFIMQRKDMLVGAIYLFGTQNNTKVSVHNLDRDFKVLGQKVGITGVRFSPHTFRHTFAVSYLRNGGNLEYLRRILGHSSLVTTQKYLRSLGVESIQEVHHLYSPLSQSRQTGR